MIKRLTFSIALGLGCTSAAMAGSFAPAAGQPGSTAISADDAAFVGWATGIELDRGPLDAASPAGGLATYGTPTDALGPAGTVTTAVVSLGDGGAATLTFAAPLWDGPGYDFAVFENSFADAFLELAFVEVSSDGQNFVRFNAISETPVDSQVGGFGALDPTNLYNLAGKYRVGYGTPFDLAELAGEPGLDLDAVTHVRVVDVIGSINPALGSYDSLGQLVNDPYPTGFASGGFDLDGVGVIHAVPEPGSWMLLATAVLALLAWRRLDRSGGDC